MGLVKDIHNLSKEYLKDPQGQWARHYVSIMKIGKDQGITYERMEQELKKFWGRTP